MPVVGRVILQAPAGALLEHADAIPLLAQSKSSDGAAETRSNHDNVIVGTHLVFPLPLLASPSNDDDRARALAAMTLRISSGQAVDGSN